MSKNLPRAAVLTALALAIAACGAGAKSEKPVAIANTPTPSATATTPAPTPKAVYPLTGLPVTSAARAARPAVSVKIDNIAQALPQSGLNQADIVTDILVEGGLTRLMATFQSQDVPLIGPIRSARPVDADLTRELNGGIFAYSGAARGEIAPSIDHSTALLISNDHNPQWFWRTDRAAPHNVYSSTSRLYKAGAASHRKFKAPPQLFAYSTDAPTGRSVSRVRIPFSSYSTASWTWTGRNYVRTQNGSPDTLSNGSRINTTNVVILSVTWRPTNIIDAAGNRDPYVIVIGSGKAWVMRNGKLIEGRWTRPSYRVPVRLTDKTGQVISLDPGRTWIELQPRPFTPTFG